MSIYVYSHLMVCLVNFNWQVKWDKKLIVLGGNLKGSSDRILGLCSMNYIIVYKTPLAFIIFLMLCCNGYLSVSTLQYVF